MIDFMRYRLAYFLLSALVLIPGLYCLIRFGLKPAIDFTGGTLVEIKVDNPQKKNLIDNARNVINSQKLELSSLQTTTAQTILMRFKPLSREQYQKLIEELTKSFGKVDEIRFETVGPVLGKELLQKTFIAAAIAATVILLYVGWAFRNVRFGVAAVLALIHDLLVVIGIFSLLGKFLGVEVDTLFVTAVLTTMSFSVHDTIVVFDRIRESQRKSNQQTLIKLINQSLTETMGRSLNNSLTIIFMLLALFLLGGETIKWFVLALLIGTISGTYSSPFVAAPILYLLHQFEDKKKR